MPPAPPRYEVIGIAGLAEVHPGDDVARLVIDAAAAQQTPVASHDVLVIGQKVISKAEGRILRLSEVEPAPPPAAWRRASAATPACSR
jgi:coenzyme F420-0:L-glutamate ligase/coenzyme F420-1:gamma-L-glutamate ligase